ncbi:MAG TPA: nucleotidyltransferase [Acetivibrio sp.]|nr:nucleotidyltransferase [Acetivibrio sp.]
MKVTGLIVEYNPFHNGHLYHLEESKKICGADYTVCVMSGNFIQRGEPAVVNKWARANMALSSGADLIIELPFPYAMSSAEFFASGSVKILNDIGIVDFLCFGSEHGNIDELDFIARILIDEPHAYKSFLKQELDRGISYPAARDTAIKEYIKHSNTARQVHAESLLSSSNNILGIEYLKALKRFNSKIIPFTIKRVNNEYGTKQITGNISSATSIRSFISTNSSQALKDVLQKVLPEASLNILLEEMAEGRGPVFAEDFYTIIASQLRRMKPGQIKGYPYVSEGLENRIKASAGSSGTYDELVEGICTKRYTRTRIQRILMSILTGMTLEQADMFNRYNGPQYARVLGFNKKGQQLLSLIKQKSVIPLVMKTADFVKSCNPLLKSMLELEAMSTDIYVLGYKNPAYKKAGQEYTQNVVIKA